MKLFKVDMPPNPHDPLPSALDVLSFDADSLVNMAGQKISRTNPYHRHFVTLKQAIEYTQSQFIGQQRTLLERGMVITRAIEKLSEHMSCDADSGERAVH